MDPYYGNKRQRRPVGYLERGQQSSDNDHTEHDQVSQMPQPLMSIRSQPHLLPQYMIFAGDLTINSQNPVIRNTVIVAGTLTCRHRLKVFGQLVVLAYKDWIPLRHYLLDPRDNEDPSNRNPNFHSVPGLDPVGFSKKTSTYDAELGYMEQVARVQTKPLLLSRALISPGPLEVKAPLAVFSRQTEPVRIAGLLASRQIRSILRQIGEYGPWTQRHVNGLNLIVSQTVLNLTLSSADYSMHSSKGCIVARDLPHAAELIGDHNASGSPATLGRSQPLGTGDMPGQKRLYEDKAGESSTKPEEDEFDAVASFE